MALRAAGLDARSCTDCVPETVLATAEGLPAGIVLLDLGLGDGRDGADLVAPLRRRGWDVLILTGHAGRERIGAALAAGAAGWVSKSSGADSLVHAIRTLAAGETVGNPREHDTLISAYQDACARAREECAHRSDATERLARLSPREHEVLEWLAEGKQAGAIATDFGVSLATVRAQIRAILTKLDVGSQLAAAAVWRRAREFSAAS
nr:response regulator transcription factor [Haloechinothrix alba]